MMKFIYTYTYYADWLIPSWAVTARDMRFDVVMVTTYKPFIASAVVSRDVSLGAGAPADGERPK